MMKITFGFPSAETTLAFDFTAALTGATSKARAKKAILQEWDNIMETLARGGWDVETLTSLIQIRMVPDKIPICGKKMRNGRVYAWPSLHLNSAVSVQARAAQQSKFQSHLRIISCSASSDNAAKLLQPPQRALFSP
ncbi:MAG: hypothetical protein K9N47_18000 [Prosthecobacter sp.]|uniref:hypothetical protein n=1 Tax=Prosthecobacter sp. TaxID=1965333 RepID=UPI0025F706BC|nr:hypothetical protein [Prosthecobacter sp.]MCF7788020.1 hypothetical protein [Prosthecobacter sp.]